MSEIITPDIWEEFQNPDDPNTPSFRFSCFFTETCDKVIGDKTAGAWLKILDTDTINDFYETYKRLDDMSGADDIDENHDTRKDLTDLLYLTILLWQWETGKTWDINLSDDDKNHLHVEYQFRLASLVHYEFLQRHGGTSKDERLERDEAQHHGLLSIYE